MVTHRGDVVWIDLGHPRGSGPGFRRPALVISDDAYNASAIRTVVVCVITSNLALAEAPGNVALEPRTTGLDRPSVVNVTQVFTVDKVDVEEPVGHLGADTMGLVDAGLRRSLGLG